MITVLVQLGIEGAESLDYPWVIPRVCWLPRIRGARQALRRPVPRSSLATAHTAAEHPRERSGQPVQQASRIAADGGMEASDAGPSMYPPKPERHLIPRAPASMDTGISSALGWFNLTTLLLRRFASVWSCDPSRLGDPKGNILRIPPAIGFNSIRPEGRTPPKPIRPPPFQEVVGGGTIPKDPISGHRALRRPPSVWCPHLTDKGLLLACRRRSA